MTLSHCEPEQSEGVAISNLTSEIASVASLPRNDSREAIRNDILDFAL